VGLAKGAVRVTLLLSLVPDAPTPGWAVATGSSSRLPVDSCQAIGSESVVSRRSNMDSVHEPSATHSSPAAGDAEQAMRRLLEAVAQVQKQNARALGEMCSQIAWLEGGGWSTGDDGLWRHARKAADIGLTHSQAFTVEARTVTASHVLDPGPTAHTVRTRNVRRALRDHAAE
jgi:hypothetical protein